MYPPFTVAGDSKQHNPRKTGYAGYPKALPQTNSNDNSESVGRNTPDTNKTSSMKGGDRRSVTSEPMPSDSANSSSSSDSSSSESSDEESDSHDEDHPTVHVSKHLEDDQMGDTTLDPIPRDTESIDSKKHTQEIEKPASSYKKDINPVRDKFPCPTRHHSQSPAKITVNAEKDRTKLISYPSLWVSIRADIVGDLVFKDRKVPSHAVSNPPLDNIHPSTKDRPLVSVGSETEQPIRRTKEVEVMLLYGR